MFLREFTKTCRRRPLTQPGQSHIRTATATDLNYVVHLQKKYTDQLGFLPTAALDAWINRNCVKIIEENGHPAGYILARHRLNSARWCRPLTQVAVAMDAQRRHNGLELLRSVATDAYGQLFEALQCWVAADIEAVQFFTAAGFVQIGERRPQNARQRPLLLFRYSLQPNQPADFYKLPAIAGARPRRLIGTPAEPLFAGTGGSVDDASTPLAHRRRPFTHLDQSRTQPTPRPLAIAPSAAPTRRTHT